MGGTGSTRWRGHQRKPLTEQLATFTAKAIGRAAQTLQQVPRPETHTIDRGGQTIQFSIEWSDCKFGGARSWLRCRCGRRVAKLFGTAADAMPVCRICTGAGYRSSVSNVPQRYWTQAKEIRRRLGARLVPLAPIWPKPRGMHWTTFQRLVYEVYLLENIRTLVILSPNAYSSLRNHPTIGTKRMEGSISWHQEQLRALRSGKHPDFAPLYRKPIKKGQHDDHQ